ncbi:(2Fe-2S)-binding protein [Photobacterium sagamiensis]|uniref:(2Fe-2S)-binding protein n=1 Tax=Photobacterium sagamiensis TaxID=2910241 RepID=UPI003D0C1C64
MNKHTVNLTVNGEALTLSIPANQTLLETLREQLNLTDTKYGCGTGECGACTVIVDGDKSINSCLTLTAMMEGRSITTAIGLVKDGQLNPVQKAFVSESAVQCGYCTPGMVLKSTSLLLNNPNPTEEEIRKELEGNICRCTGYDAIVKAVQKAAEDFPVINAAE